ncbi:MAG: sigma-70 family RNA polymerase sigma factor [Desulfobacterales bacterium]|nr:sigma-70 family RNA polymerase sigma factor [Desulfobacterales bacterium]
MAKQHTLTPARSWVAAHGDYLYTMALVRVRDETIAQDLVQETFMAALRSRDNFKGKSTEKTWLTGILKHKILDWLRKKYRESAMVELPADQENPEDWFDRKGQWKDGPTPWPDTPEDLLEQKSFLDMVKECLKSLPKKQSRVLSLRTLDNAPTEEICKVLGITPTNCWVILHRARSLMRKCIQTRWPGKRDGKGEAA